MTFSRGFYRFGLQYVGWQANIFIATVQLPHQKTFLMFQCSFSKLSVELSKMVPQLAANLFGPLVFTNSIVADKPADLVFRAEPGRCSLGKDIAFDLATAVDPAHAVPRFLVYVFPIILWIQNVYSLLCTLQLNQLELSKLFITYCVCFRYRGFRCHTPHSCWCWKVGF